MMLKDKVAVIYGAGGAIGSAVARAFAREGAELYLTGRRRASVEAVAKEIASTDGSADAAEVDALDEHGIDRHLQSVIDKAGRVDISFNAVGIPNVKILGVPLIELDVEQFSLPITTYATSYFLTARMAARRMIPNESGVIMTVTALHSRTGLPLVGGYGPAMAAKEALTRDLSAELAPQGIRVVGLRPQGMPETHTIKDAYEPRAKASGLTWEQWQELLASRTHPRRLMTLDEMAAWRGANAFTAAERAGADRTAHATFRCLARCIDDVWANVRNYHDDDQLAAPVAQVALINTFNRMNVMTRQRAGHDELVKLHGREYLPRRSGESGTTRS